MMMRSSPAFTFVFTRRPLAVWLWLEMMRPLPALTFDLTFIFGSPFLPRSLLEVVDGPPAWEACGDELAQVLQGSPRLVRNAVRPRLGAEGRAPRGPHL